MDFVTVVTRETVRQESHFQGRLPLRTNVKSRMWLVKVLLLTRVALLSRICLLQRNCRQISRLSRAKKKSHPLDWGDPKENRVRMINSKLLFKFGKTLQQSASLLKAYKRRIRETLRPKNLDVLH
jgi:hypothetical protein